MADHFFADRITSKECDIIAVVGTSALNCCISSDLLYYIFVKSHPRTFVELIQLISRLKHGNGKCVLQDQIHILLSIPNFVTI